MGSDGLGRLKEVYEDPTTLNYLTGYSYDVLDNLTTVSQGVQTAHVCLRFAEAIDFRNQSRERHGYLRL